MMEAITPRIQEYHDRVESITERNKRLGNLPSSKAHSLREHLLSTPSQIADGVVNSLRQFEV